MNSALLLMKRRTALHPGAPGRERATAGLRSGRRREVPGARVAEPEVLALCIGRQGVHASPGQSENGNRSVCGVSRDEPHEQAALLQHLDGFCDRTQVSWRERVPLGVNELGFGPSARLTPWAML